MRDSDQLVTFVDRSLGKKNIQAKNGRRTEYRVKDGRGNVMQKLVLHVHANDKRVWRVHYDIKKGTRRVRRKLEIGDNETALADVRKRWLDALRLLEDGGDPEKERRQQALKAANALSEDHSFKALADEFIEAKKLAGKKSWQEDRRQLKHDVMPVLSDIPAFEVSENDIQLIIDKIVGRGSLSQAAHILVLLKSIFNWGKRRPAWKQAGLRINPTEDIMRPYKPRPRKRFLSDDEIKTVWLAVDEAGMTDAGRIAMRLALATGQRPGEVIGIAKSELHLDHAEAFWLIPEGRTKNSNEHKVPLSPIALKQIEKALAILDKEKRDSDYLFPSPRQNKGDRPCGEGLIRRGLDRMFREGLLTGKRFSPHDLRRTVASHMAALGVDRTVIGKVLNHISMDNASVTGMHYDQHLYAEEKRHALELWAQKLERIVGEEKEK